MFKLFISDQLNDTEFLLITLKNKESIRIFDLKNWVGIFINGKHLSMCGINSYGF